MSVGVKRLSPTSRINARRRGVDKPAWGILYAMEDEKSVNLKRKIIEKGVKQLLDEAKVPLRAHLKVVKELKLALDRHKKDQSDWKGVLDQHEKGLKTHAELSDKHVEQVNALGSEIQRLSERDWTGPQGESGQDGNDAKEVDIEGLASLVLSRIPPAKDGIDGNHGKDAETPSVDALVEAVVARVQKGDVLHISHVKGASGFIKDGIRYRFEELMHGSGSGTGSSGITLIPVTGTRDDSNVTFTVTTTPTVLNINGGLYEKTGGSITWSIAGTTITLSSPVGTGGSISGLK